MPFDGVLFVTTDVGKWGTGKGAPLTASEADNDLWELLSRLETLETSPPTAVSISNISVIGTQMQFNMSDGSHFGPFTLPLATFEFRGDYVVGTPYNELDIVSVPGQGLFLVRIAHNGENPFNPDLVITSSNAYLKIFGEDTFIYDLGWYYPGKPGNGIDVAGAMAAHIFVRNVTLPAGLPGSSAELQTATTLSLSFPLQKAGVSIGSIDFAPGATVATFTFAADVLFAPGEIVRLIRPTTLDVAAKELSVTILGNRS